MFKMKKSTKKFLSVFLTIVITLSLVSVLFVNATTTENEIPGFKHSAGAEITLGDGTVAFNGRKSDWVSATLPTALPKIIVKPIFSDTITELYLAITDGAIASDIGVDYNSAKGLVLKLAKRDASLVISYYKDSSFIDYATVAGYDFTKAHTISWARNGFAWKLSVDSNTLTPTEDIGFNSRIFEIGAESTFTFFGGENGFEFENVKLLGNVSESFTGTNGSITAIGDKDNGYSLTGSGTLAAYNKSFSFENTEINFKAPDLKTSGCWAFVVISNTYGGRTYPDTEGTSLNPSNATSGDGNSIAVGFMMRDEGTSCLITTCGTSTSYNLGKISFNFSAEHKISFKNESSKWYLCIDETNKFDVTNRVSALKGKNVFYTFMNSGIEISKIKFNDISTANEPTGVFFSNDTSTYITVGGDATDGYTATNKDKSKLVGLKTPIDLETQAVQFQNNATGISASDWTTLAFSSSDTYPNDIYYQAKDKTRADENYNVLRFMFYKQTEYLDVRVYGASTYVYGRYYSFDWSLPHTYQFVQSPTDGKWDLYIDGKALTVGSGQELYTAHENARNAMNDILDKLLLSDAYTYFGNVSVAADFSAIKRVEKISSSPIEFTKSDYIKRTYNNLVISKPATINTEVVANIYSKDAWVYSNEIGSGLTFGFLSKNQAVDVKLVYVNGETANTKICAAGDVNEIDGINICDLVAMKKLIVDTKTTYNSDMDGDNGTNATDLSMLRKILLGVPIV